jgi:hypothetical protein
MGWGRSETRLGAHHALNVQTRTVQCAATRVRIVIRLGPTACEDHVDREGQG